MITCGLDKLCTVLPLDHRGSFKTKTFVAKVGPHVNTGFSAPQFGPRPWAGIHVPFYSKNLR
jgi:hypothetical protein